MDDFISRRFLLAEYDRVHTGEPGKARKLIEDAPAVDCVKEYCISYAVHDGFGGKVEGMVIFPSLLKVLLWFLRKGRRCCEIYIYTSRRAASG